MGTAVLLALWLVSGCRTAPDGQQARIDLLELFPYTGNAKQNIEIDFASLDGHAYLRGGWSAPEPGPQGKMVRWAAEGRASIEIDLPSALDRQLILRASATTRRARLGTVNLRINRRRLTTFPLREGMFEYRTRIPAELQAVGINVIEFTGPARPSPEFAGGVAYERLSLTTGNRAGTASVSVEGDSLLIPPRQHVEFFIRPPVGGELRFDEYRGAVTLRIHQEHGKEEELTILGHGTAPHFDLSAYAPRPIRLDLISGETDPAVLQRPAIYASSRASVEPAQRPAPKSNVLLYVIDTLRADHLGCYGYGLPTSPEIDAFAREAVVFDRVVAQASWTRPATASILTGASPPVHGARTLRQKMRSDIATLAEEMKSAGFQTGAFVTNFNLAPRWGLQRGFDSYIYLEEDPAVLKVHVSADDLHRRALAWLDERRGHPFFLYVHSTDVHAPYTPPAEETSKFLTNGRAVPAAEAAGLLKKLRETERAQVADTDVAGLIANYDAEIGFVDRELGHLLTALRERGLYDDTIVVITADHGEEFHDHGSFEHGHTLYQEQLHVPLLIKWPGSANAGQRTSQLGRQIDIAPTILSILGLRAPASMEGRPLIPQGGDDVDEAFAETQLGRRQSRAMVVGDTKVIRSSIGQGERVEVFDLAHDAGELRPIAENLPILSGYVRQSLSWWLSGTRSGGVVPATSQEIRDPAVEERLRSLGYAE